MTWQTKKKYGGPCKGKRPYFGMFEATRFRKKIHWNSNHEVYLCPRCAHYHIGRPPGTLINLDHRAKYDLSFSENRVAE